MTWPAPTAQRWITHRVCPSCETGQRTAPHEPCWSCHGPTVDGVLWPAGGGIVPHWGEAIGRITVSETSAGLEFEVSLNELGAQVMRQVQR